MQTSDEIKSEANDISLGEVLKKDYQFINVQMASALIAGEAISYDNINPFDVGIDYEKSKVIAEQVDRQHEIKRAINHEERTTDIVLETTKSKAINIYNKLINEFVDSGVVTEELSTIVNTQLFTPQNITIKEGFDGYLYYDGHLFPSNTLTEGPIMIFGVSTIKEFEEEIKNFLVDAEVDNDLEMVEDIALSLMISHEYGHLIHKTIIYNELSKIENTSTYDLFKVNEEIYINGFKDIFESKDLKIFCVDDFELRAAVDERISVGFERIGLKLALIRNGLPEEKVNSILDKYKEKDNKRINEWKSLIQLGESNGIPFVSLKYALNDIDYTLNNGLRRENQKKYSFRPTYGFTGQYFGYFFPISEKEVKSLLKAFSK